MDPSYGCEPTVRSGCILRFRSRHASRWRDGRLSRPLRSRHRAGALTGQHEGWVVVDYKTDVGTDPKFEERLVGYRRQVDHYADAWGALTGDPVKKRVLFFTTQDRVERW